jgi:hypothetical protein
MTAAGAGALLLQDILGVVLLAAGGAKISDLAAFSGTFRGLPGLTAHRRLSLLAAGLVVALELAIGMLLLLDFYRREVGIASLGLTCGFVLVTVVALISGSRLECRCFGSLARSSFDREALVRSLALAAIAASLVAIDHAGRTPAAPSTVMRSLLLASGAMFSAACAVAAMAISTLAQQRQTRR